VLTLLIKFYKSPIYLMSVAKIIPQDKYETIPSPEMHFMYW